MKAKRVLVELRSLILMVGLLWSSTVVLGSTEHFPGQIVGNNIQGDSVLIEDDKIGTTYWNSILVNSSVKNMVLFEMDEESFTIPPKSGVYRVDLTIEVWDSADVNNTNPTTTLYQTLEFDYDTTKTNKTPFRSFIQLEGYHRMKIEVTTLTFPTGVSSAPLRVYGEIIIDRIYEFDCHQAVDFATGAFPSTLQSNSFTVEWDPIVTVDEYDLEWTFYDSLSTVASDNGTYQDFNHLFRHNATRITTDQSSYELQLLYPAGAVFFRIRAVHYNADGVREYSKWNAVTSSGMTYANFPHQIEVGWHEADYNWQSRVLFAEEGKNVPSISYFDGSQRGRQDVTLSNTDTMSLVSQTIYDYHGRPAISVLPAPTFQSHMRYDSSFALNSSLETYTKADFDEGACDVLPASMSTSAGASKYFSPLNPSASDGFHRFIPDAEGFPFTVTEYTPDQTGRIARQGGVGDTLGIRKGHDTQYLYGKPAQEELDRLFGNEAGDESHYFKNAVISPDSQISVSYLDAHGRTIATALAGEQPESVDSLQNKTPVSSLKRDLLNNLKTTYTLSSTYSLLVTTVTDSLIFDYQLDSALYQPSCVDTSICYDCLYDLEITISDNCGNAFNGGNPYIITQANATPSTYDTLCTNLPAGIDTLFSLQNLPIGEYKITKTLQINQEALNYYADHYLTQSDCLPSLDSLIEAFKAETDFSGCGMDCDSCLDDLGTQADFINRVKQSLLDAGGTFSTEDSLDLVTQYAQLVTECEGLCLIVDECEALLSQMRADVTPGGQYALVTFDPLAINTTDATSIFYQNSYQDSTLQYTNQNGQPDTIIIDGISYTPNQLDSLQFVQNWNPAWADTLIKYFHPEYCYLDWCWMNEASNSYDAELEDITTLTDAINSGFVDSLGNINLDDDPFFQTGGKGEDCQASMGSLLQHMNPYDTTSISIIDFIEQQIYGGGFPCDTDFGEGTTAENNLAWEVLRNFYFGFKERIKQDKRDALQNCDPEVDCIGTSAGSCATNPYRNKIRRLNPIRITAADYSLDSLAAGQANALQEIATECAENCANNVNYWLQRLEGCNLLDSLQRDTAITRMQAICELGCDSEHLFGASTTALDVNGQHLVTTYGDTSFVQILTDLLGSANYCDLDCSANMIDFPAPYESQYQGPKPILSKNECLCENLADLEACYTADSLGYADFSSYLLQFSSTPLTLAEIDTLKRYCGALSASRYLPQQIDIPPYLECGICKSCDEVQPLVTQFNAICTDPSSIDYPELRARYLNQQLGLSITALEYDNFLAQCTNNPFPAGCSTAPMLCPSTPFEKVVPDTSCYSTLMAQITVQAQLAYQDLLDSLRAAFVNAYLDSCLNTPTESFDLEGTFQEYQYTLYYYDLAGNLVKTIPPKGVTPLSTQGALDSVAAHRADPSEPMILPEHTLPTVYVYNSLNEIIWEDNPDADSIQYWYDRVGRLVVSQDGRERDANYYSYTDYDEQGRIVELGTIRSPGDPMTDAIAKDDASLSSWFSGKNLLDVQRTFYDETPFTVSGVNSLNLRSRVAVTTFSQNLANTTITNYTTASHYSYDMTGNVNTLVQEYKVASAYDAITLKQIDYEYDFLSGNVNAFYYQRGQWDQFTHRYQYDDNNRLSKVHTSLSYTDEPLESPLWEQDATYDYYLHGPLARTELGHYRVQGMDYAYNLQGWIKGVNSGHLNPTRDMGQDGKSGGTLSQRGIARDAYGYTLGYFDGDYQPIGGSSSNFELAYAGSTFANSDSSLYNGNIRQVVAHNKQLGAARGHSYRYDQLHRIRKGRIWEYSDAGTYSWVGTGTASNKHLTAYQYDPNGNLTNLLRYNDSPSIMDNLGYAYYDGTNRLSQVGDGHTGTDGVPSGQSANNYVYDETGNLIRDAQSDTRIEWNSFGKVATVLVDDAIFYGRRIDFRYGPDQNRWFKSYYDINSLTETLTYYVRDAQGNVLSTYQISREGIHNTSYEFTWQECYLYGSGRLGTLRPNRTYNGTTNAAINLPDSAIFTGDSISLCLGWKQYEIANHLDNVTATVNDRKRPIDTNADNIADYYEPIILSATDYYPFGMDMPNRTFNANDYRFGFNGKEADRNGEWGSLNHYDYGFRIYNPGIAKFLSVDPLRREYPWYTPYQFAGNTPIQAIDLDGLEPTVTNRARTQANQAINNFQNSNQNNNQNFFSLINKSAFIADLRSKVNNPEGMFQNDTPLCGAALSCLAMAEFDIAGYTQVAIDLYETGQSNFRGLTLESSSEQMLAANSYQFGTSGNLSPVDYVLFTAIKNEGNVLFEYVPGKYDNLSKGDKFVFDGWDGFTYPREIQRRLTEFGLNVKQNNSPFGNENQSESLLTRNLAKWNTILSVGGEVGLLIDHSVWNSGASGLGALPNHYVAFRGSNKNPNGTYSVEYWTWGQRKRVVLTSQQLINSIFSIYEISKK